MGIFDWFQSSPPEPATPSGMSRRDFFARVAGQGEARPAEDEPEETPGLLCAFYVARFPYHDGPVLVPILRPGLDFLLIPDSDHPTDPEAVRIQWGRDRLGYVAPEHSAEIRKRLKEGEVLYCRSVAVDPGAELSRVLKVEIVRHVEPGEGEDGEEGDEEDAEQETA